MDSIKWYHTRHIALNRKPEQTCESDINNCGKRLSQRIFYCCVIKFIWLLEYCSITEQLSIAHMYRSQISRLYLFCRSSVASIVDELNSMMESNALHTYQMYFIQFDEMVISLNFRWSIFHIAFLNMRWFEKIFFGCVIWLYRKK